MTAERWEKVKQLFGEALEVPVDQRAEFLQRICGSDDELTREVTRLLGEHQQASSTFLEPSAEGPVSSDSLLGTLLEGRYQIAKELGRGGSGVVYLAHDQQLHSKPVVVKFLHQWAEQNPRLQAKFRQEVEALARIHHPGVVGVLGAGELPPAKRFVVMEYVEGVTLRSQLDDSPLDLARVARIVQQVAQALTAVHREGVLHRDLKPENVMLERLSSGEETVRLIDFGIAKVAQSQFDANTKGTMSFAGTLSYAAPEQLMGKATAASDIYSLGVIAYEMVTGERPFHPETPFQLYELQRNTTPQDPSRLRPGLPFATAQCILKALSFRSEDRHPSAEEFAASLEAALSRGSNRLHKFVYSIPRRIWLLSGLALTITAVTVAALLSLRARPGAKIRGGAMYPISLTSDSGLNRDPALSADGNWIAYASDRASQGATDGNLNIWIQQPGSAPLQLTRHPANDYAPSFSPDGRSIAFRSDRDGGGIYVVPVFGGMERRIADLGREPRFSPDGRWIAYSVESGNTSVHIVSSDGSIHRKLDPQCGYDAGTPVWSADSQNLLFWCEAIVGQGPDRTADWWIMPAAGGAAKQTGAFNRIRKRGLTAFMNYSFHADSWSGDDVFFTTQSDAASGIWKISILGPDWHAASDPVQVASLDGLVIGASRAGVPDGRLNFAFTRLTINMDVWSLAADVNRGAVTGSPRRLTEGPLHKVWPSVSADGRRVAFGLGEPGARSIGLMEASTGRSLPFAAPADISLGPILSRDGSRMAYTIVRQGRRSMWFIGTEPGDTPHKICDECGRVFDWSPDGTAVLAYLDYDAWGDNASTISLVDIHSGKRSPVVTGRHFTNPRFSPDGRWVSGELWNDAGSELRIALFPFPANRQLPAMVTSPATEFNVASWSPDGNLIYLVSPKDGFRCIWAQRLDPSTKKPVGAPFAVYHSHSARLSMMNAGNGIGLGIASDKFVFTQGEITGNVSILRSQ